MRFTQDQLPLESATTKSLASTFDAKLDRETCVVCEVKPPSLPPLVFATSHLESLDEYQACLGEFGA